MSTPTFVVGTGRCGSTMLSNMLRDHPKVLSLSEFYGMLSDFSGVRLPKMFPAEKADGRAFWGFVAEITPTITFLVQHRIEPPEILYPLDDPAARYSRESGVPAILGTTLPHLTDRFDTLFDELGAEVSTWDEAAFGEHYQALFEWLATRFGKAMWVERTGGAVLMALDRVIEAFPQARFVHLVRDGRDCALSMSEHLGFRSGLVMNGIAEFLGVSPLESHDRSSLDRVPPELRQFMPEHFDAAAFRNFRVDSQLCGGYWAREVENGIRRLSRLPPERMLLLRYEDFFDDAEEQLDRLTRFFGEEYVDDAWSARCAAEVRTPRSTWRDLPAEEVRKLTEACRPGFELLREVGVEYEV